MVKLPEGDFDITDLNHTELVQLANWNGLKASRAYPRERIIEALENYQPFEDGPFDHWRVKLSKWLHRWWSIVRMQVPKKVCPRCDLCRDAQVLDCYMKNKTNIER